MFKQMRPFINALEIERELMTRLNRLNEDIGNMNANIHWYMQHPEEDYKHILLDTNKKNVTKAMSEREVLQQEIADIRKEIREYLKEVLDSELIVRGV